MSDQVEKVYFSVWNSTEGFCIYDITFLPDYSIWEAFVRTVEESQNRQFPIETEYMGQPIRWSFAYGEPDRMVERLDEDRTFAELGIKPGATITVSPIEYLGSSDEIARIRKDRRQLIQFMDQNPESIKLLKATPRAFFLQINGFKGISRLSKDGSPEFSFSHQFAIHLGNPHPYEEPLVAPVTEIFHPNVSMEKRKMCIWTNYHVDQNFLLPLICYQVADLIQFNLDKINLEEPHRFMNVKASEWFESFKPNHPDFFPLSRRSFRWNRIVCKRCGRTLTESGSSVCPLCGAQQ